MMTYSLNEIDVYCRRAARGAGMSWGLAEEAGKAARWLVLYGFPGPELLLQLLQRNDGKAYETLAPAAENDIWQAQDAGLCPLIAGAALSDRAAAIADGEAIALSAVTLPILLAPFAAAIARQTGRAVSLRWPGVDWTFCDGGARWSGGERELFTASCDWASCQMTDSGPVDQRPQIKAYPIPAAVWQGLNRYALRTYAPATESSRSSGAGAGLNDND